MGRPIMGLKQKQFHFPSRQNELEGSSYLVCPADNSPLLGRVWERSLSAAGKKNEWWEIEWDPVSNWVCHNDSHKTDVHGLNGAQWTVCNLSLKRRKLTNYKLFSGTLFDKTRARDWLVDTKLIQNLPNFQKTRILMKGEKYMCKVYEKMYSKKWKDLKVLIYGISSDVHKRKLVIFSWKFILTFRSPHNRVNISLGGEKKI